MVDFSDYLFETNAFKICDENKPFWYTSGKIGPYFVNGHFLYGNEKEANSLLDYINSELENSSKDIIPRNIFSKVLHQYQHNSIYAVIINSLISYLRSSIDTTNIDYISGGERRDWYFSNIISYLLKKPHITIYKDLTCCESSFDFSTNKISNKIGNKSVLHVADLLNQASSYTRAWIPAITNLGAQIKWSLVCIDRKQGGSKILEENQIQSLSLINIDQQLFEKAFELGIINKNQKNS